MHDSNESFTSVGCSKYVVDSDGVDHVDLPRSPLVSAALSPDKISLFDLAPSSTLLSPLQARHHGDSRSYPVPGHDDARDWGLQYDFEQIPGVYGVREGFPG